MRTQGRLLCAGILVAALAGCRTDPDDLSGTWEGTLDCTADADGWAETATADVSLEVQAPVAGLHSATLDLTLDWARDDGAAYVQWSRFGLELDQEFGKGAQKIDVPAADCEDARSTLDDDVTGEGCDDVEPGLGLSTLRWDGVDGLDWTGDCVGSLERTAGLPVSQ